MLPSTNKEWGLICMWSRTENWFSLKTAPKSHVYLSLPDFPRPQWDGEWNGLDWSEGSDPWAALYGEVSGATGGGEANSQERAERRRWTVVGRLRLLVRLRKVHESAVKCKCPRTNKYLLLFSTPWDFPRPWLSLAMRCDLHLDHLLGVSIVLSWPRMIKIFCS